MFGIIIDPVQYREIMEEVNNKKIVSTKGYFTVKSGEGQNSVATIDTSKITFNDAVTAPKLIIIDEVTHFSGVEL
jgi:hypothetical protein